MRTISGLLGSETAADSLIFPSVVSVRYHSVSVRTKATGVEEALVARVLCSECRGLDSGASLEPSLDPRFTVVVSTVVLDVSLARVKVSARIDE